MPLPVADFDKRPVVFVDALVTFLADLYRAFDVQFVLTSNVAAGPARSKVASALVQAGFPLVAQHFHADWATPYEADSDLGEQVQAWHATVADRTPTSYLVITTKERAVSLDHILADYAVVINGQHDTDVDYVKACQILHSQTSFELFNSDWY